MVSSPTYVVHSKPLQLLMSAHLGDLALLCNDDHVPVPNGTGPTSDNHGCPTRRRFVERSLHELVALDWVPRYPKRRLFRRAIAGAVPGSTPWPHALRCFCSTRELKAPSTRKAYPDPRLVTTRMVEHRPCGKPRALPPRRVCSLGPGGDIFANGTKDMEAGSCCTGDI